MLIAFVWNADRRDSERRAVDLSFRFELYVEGMRQLGHEAVVVCRTGGEGEAPYPTATGSGEDLETTDFWRRLGADVAIPITHHRRVPMLEALQRAGVPALALADSDGRVGLHAHPWATVERAWVYLDGLRPKLGAAKYFLGRWLRGRARDTEALEAVASTQASHSVIFHSRPAIDAFRRLLRQHGVERPLAPRLHAVPFAVHPDLCEAQLEAPRRDRVLAVGRWTDPQKDTPLMRRTLEGLAIRRPQTEVWIYGRGTEDAFGDLAERFPSLRLQGFCSPDTLHRQLAQARCILFTSRWETGPHAATEALALGATVVGAPIPNLVGLTAGGRFGAVAAGRRPGQVVRALVDELERWDGGDRDSQAIAEYWRRQLHPTAVCRQLLATLDRPPGVNA